MPKSSKLVALVVLFAASLTSHAGATYELELDRLLVGDALPPMIDRPWVTATFSQLSNVPGSTVVRLELSTSSFSSDYYVQSFLFNWGDNERPDLPPPLHVQQVSGATASIGMDQNGFSTPSSRGEWYDLRLGFSGNTFGANQTATFDITLNNNPTNDPRRNLDNTDFFKTSSRTTGSGDTLGSYYAASSLGGVCDSQPAGKDACRLEPWISTSPAVTVPIPEPETYAMLLAGLGLLGLTARRRRPKLSA